MRGDAAEELAGSRYIIKSGIFAVRRRMRLSLLVLPFKLVVEFFRRTVGIINIIKKEKCNCIITCTGDIINLPAAYLACKITKTPFVAYIFDYFLFQWTGVVRKFVGLIEPIIIKGAKKIIVPNEKMQDEYLERYGVKSVIIRNPCDIIDNDNCFESERDKEQFNSEFFNIVYTGSVYHAQLDAFINLLNALQFLQEIKIKLHVYTSQLKQQLEQYGIAGDFVEYHGHINENKIPCILQKADMLFLPLAFDSKIPEVVRTSSPGKTGEYLASGKVILVHAPKDSFLSEYFRTHFCGIIIDDNDYIILADAIRKVIYDKELQVQLGHNAKQMAIKDFSSDEARKSFMNCIEEIIHA